MQKIRKKGSPLGSPGRATSLVSMGGMGQPAGEALKMHLVWLLSLRISSLSNVWLIRNSTWTFSDTSGWFSSILVIFEIFQMVQLVYQISLGLLFGLELCQFGLHISSLFRTQMNWNFVGILFDTWRSSPSSFVNFRAPEEISFVTCCFDCTLYFGLVHFV